MNEIYPTVYSMIFGEKFYKTFVHANQYEKLTVVKQFVPIYDMSVSDSLEVEKGINVTFQNIGKNTETI